MKDWFKFNGVSCATLGMVVLEQPSFAIPEERVEYTDVPGRSGSLTMLEAEDTYNDITLTARCTIPNPNNIPSIAKWLKGLGTIEFANRDGGFYQGKLINSTVFDKVMRGHPNLTFPLAFRCKPFWHNATKVTHTWNTSSHNMVYHGTVFGAPTITILPQTNVTTGTLTLNSLGANERTVSFTGLTSAGIILDCENEEAYLPNGTSANSKMSGNFFRLYNDSDGLINKVTFTGLSSVKFEYYERYL